MSFFSFFCFSIFWEKRKIEKWSRNRRLVYFSHFSNNIKKIKIAKYRFQPFTVFFVFLNLTSKLEKRKNDRFSWPFTFLKIFSHTLKYVNMIRISNMSFFLLEKWKKYIGRSVHGPMCVTLYTVVFHSNGQYIMLPAHCDCLQTEAANCRLRVKFRQGANAEWELQT